MKLIKFAQYFALLFLVFALAILSIFSTVFKAAISPLVFLFSHDPFEVSDDILQTFGLLRLSVFLSELCISIYNKYNKNDVSN